jgi:hypothetical protein
MRAVIAIFMVRKSLGRSIQTFIVNAMSGAGYLPICGSRTTGRVSDRPIPASGKLQITYRA